MKVYPTTNIKKKAESEINGLSTTERVTKTIALIIAFATVYFFSLKFYFFKWKTELYKAVYLLIRKQYSYNGLKRNCLLTRLIIH